MSISEGGKSDLNLGGFNEPSGTELCDRGENDISLLELTCYETRGLEVDDKYVMDEILLSEDPFGDVEHTS